MSRKTKIREKIKKLKKFKNKSKETIEKQISSSSGCTMTSQKIN
jgi:hypothetical protein